MLASVDSIVAASGLCRCIPLLYGPLARRGARRYAQDVAATTLFSVLGSPANRDTTVSWAHSPAGRMIQTIFASLVLAASTTGANSEPLPSLIERIPRVARSEHRGVSPEEQELAKAIQSYGPDAIPSVLPL